MFIVVKKKDVLKALAIAITATLLIATAAIGGIAPVYLANAKRLVPVYSVETGSQYRITGRVLLPGFVTAPEMYLADAESGEGLVWIELTAAPEDKYRCLGSEYSYIPYNFELAVAESLLASRNRFMLATDTEPVKLSVNFLKGSELAAMRSNGELCVKKRDSSTY